jgi:hypothetical protein
MKRFFTVITVLVVLVMFIITLISNSILKRRIHEQEIEKEILRAQLQRWKSTSVVLAARYIYQTGEEVTISKIAAKCLETYEEVSPLTTTFFDTSREEISLPVQIAVDIYSSPEGLRKLLGDVKF